MNKRFLFHAVCLSAVISFFLIPANDVLAFEPLFNSSLTYSAGYVPASVCAADLDGDGDLDLAVANIYSHNVSVLINNGDGMYAGAVNYGTGDGPHSVCAGDMDGDDDLDLAVANEYSRNVSILFNLSGITTDVQDNPLVPVRLSSNYPNPFNPVTTLKFNVPRTGHVTIAVYDVTGRKVRVLVDRVFQMGAFETTWNGKNTAGESVGSGVYFARMETCGHKAVRKMVLLR